MSEQSEHIPVPEILYHYTGGDTARSILTNQEFWATEAHFLNDPTEVHQALNFAIEELGRLHNHYNAEVQKNEDRFNQTSGWQVNNDDVSKELRRINIGTSLTTHTMHFLISGFVSSYKVCIVSLSTEGDSLSQWRAYCPNGGFALGFSGQKLNELVSNLRLEWKLEPCIYKTVEEKRVFIKGKVQQLINTKVEQYTNDSPYVDWSVGHGNFGIRPNTEDFSDYSPIADKIIALAAIVKDKSFEDEREWRLVGKIYGSNLQFRSREEYIIPFTVFNQPLYGEESKKKLPLKHVTVGPFANKELAKLGLINFLKTKTIFEEDGAPIEDKISVTNTPYRIKF
jgi:hypothetical protein